MSRPILTLNAGGNKTKVELIFRQGHETRGRINNTSFYQEDTLHYSMMTRLKRYIFRPYDSHVSPVKWRDMYSIFIQQSSDFASADSLTELFSHNRGDFTISIIQSI